MLLKSLYNTNAVLENSSDDEILFAHDFEFLGQKISWESTKDKIGQEVILSVTYPHEDESIAIQEAMRKFTSLVLFRQKHVEKFENRTSIIFSGGGTVGQSIAWAVFDPRYILTLNEHSYSEKVWTMLAFYQEYKNSISIFYKFICLYKIIELENTQTHDRNGRRIVVGDDNATKTFINNQLPLIIPKDDLNTLKTKISRSRVRDKSFGGYFKHMLRDSFSHTGLLTNNNYKYGYPSLSPTNNSDELKFHQGVMIFSELAERLILPKVN
jgi:hypothetical protein